MMGALELRSKLNSLKFVLRQRIWGEIRLRRSLPPPASGKHIENERAFYKKLICRVFTHEERVKFSQVWDIGCRNWSYAPALAETLPNAELVGVEVDGSRRYWNLFRRKDQVQSQVDELLLAGKRARCMFEDFKTVPLGPIEGKALFCFFYPFVSEEPCLKWGLSLEFVDFGALLKHALTQPNSVLFSVHQGEWEAEIARKVYRDLGLEYKELVVPVEQFQGLWPSLYEAHLFVTGVKI